MRTDGRACIAPTHPKSACVSVLSVLACLCSTSSGAFVVGDFFKINEVRAMQGRWEAETRECSRARTVRRH